MKTRIRELRKARKMTMKQLGEVLGVAESTISQYETGKRQPDNETLLRLGEFFGVTVGYILGAETEKAPTSEPDRKITEEEIKAAFFEGSEDLPPEEMAALWDDARDYIQWKINQRRKKND